MNHLTHKLTQLLIVLVAALSLAVVKGTCHCGDVCPSYIEGAWGHAKTCPAPLPYPYHGIEVNDINYPGGGCACNYFGCNCTACYCQGRRTATHEATSICEDYHTYMNMTRREKVERLASIHCTKPSSNSTSGEVVRHQPRKSIDIIAESMADTNNDGELSCEEFRSHDFSHGTKPGQAMHRELRRWYFLYAQY